MAAAFRLSSNGGGTSGTGNRTSAIVAAAGDLLIVFVQWSGNSAVNPTCTDNGAGGTYTLILTALNNASGDIQAVFVRNNLVSAGATLTISPVVGSGSNTAGEVVTVAVSGMQKTGAAAVRGSGKQENQTSGVPTPVLGASALTTNMTLMSAGSSASSGTITSVPNASWTEREDAQQSTPSTSVEVATRNSGFTGTSAAYVSIVSVLWNAVILELDGSLSQALTGSMSTFSGATAKSMLLAKTGFAASMSTFAGALVRQAQKVLAASMSTFAGALVKQALKVLSASMSTFAGAIAKLMILAKAGFAASTSTFAGALTKMGKKTLPASMTTFSAVLVRFTSKTFAGAMNTFAGALTKSMGKILAGAMALWSAVLTATTGGAQHFEITIAASMSAFSGALVKFTSKTIAASMSAWSAALPRKTGKLISAAMSSFGGTLVKLTSKTIAASIPAFSGAVVKLTSKTITASMAAFVAAVGFVSRTLFSMGSSVVAAVVSISTAVVDHLYIGELVAQDARIVPVVVSLGALIV
jgi:hypothetical protein